MIPFEETAAMLDEIADEFPKALYTDLNGGVYLLPDVKLHDESRNDQPLYIMGEYVNRRDTGRFINLYYGSIGEVYGHCTAGELRHVLKRILAHELTHNMEFLAGECGLEIKDEAELSRYRERRKL